MYPVSKQKGGQAPNRPATRREGGPKAPSTPSPVPIQPARLHASSSETRAGRPKAPTTRRGGGPKAPLTPSPVPIQPAQLHASSSETRAGRPKAPTTYSEPTALMRAPRLAKSQMLSTFHPVGDSALSEKTTKDRLETLCPESTLSWEKPPNLFLLRGVSTIPILAMCSQNQTPLFALTLPTEMDSLRYCTATTAVYVWLNKQHPNFSALHKMIGTALERTPEPTLHSRAPSQSPPMKKVKTKTNTVSLDTLPNPLPPRSLFCAPTSSRSPANQQPLATTPPQPAHIPTHFFPPPIPPQRLMTSRDVADPGSQ
jgi:hypothetical protein